MILVHGILCQLPLPGHRDEAQFIHAIAPPKDVDGLHPLNAGLLLQGRLPLSCTPAGILTMLKAYDLPLAGKHCVVIGRSNMVGKPVALNCCSKKMPRLQWHIPKHWSYPRYVDKGIF